MTADKKKQYNAEYYRKHKEKWKDTRKKQKRTLLSMELRNKSLQYRKDISKSSASDAKIAKRMISSAAAYNEASKAYQQSRGMERQNLKKQRTRAGYEFIASLLHLGDSKDPSIKRMSAKMLRDFRKTRNANTAKEFVRAILNQ